jgi:hypothetical protein
MRAVVCRGLTVLAASLFALPAGWCCMLPSPRLATARPCKSCCGSCPVQRQSWPAPEQGKHPCPGFPFVSCCYLATGALPVRTVAQATKLSLTPTASSAGEVRAPAAPAQHLAHAVHHGPSPPLYILHCVWLC